MTAIIIFIIVVFTILFILWFITVSNKLNRALVKIEEANSGIDIALAKRYDVLTKMMKIVKTYTKYEEDVIFKVIKLRQNMSIEEMENVNKKMNDNFEQLKILAENYPELKSSENYNTLQETIVDVEEHLQAARRMYNANVSVLNQSLVTFPENIVAKMKGMTKHEFFELETNKREDIKIDL